MVFNIAYEAWSDGRAPGIGFEPVGGTPRQFADDLKTELVKWARVVRKTGARAE